MYESERSRSLHHYVRGSQLLVDATYVQAELYTQEQVEYSRLAILQVQRMQLILAPEWVKCSVAAVRARCVADIADSRYQKVT